MRDDNACPPHGKPEHTMRCNDLTVLVTRVIKASRVETTESQKETVIRLTQELSEAVELLRENVAEFAAFQKPDCDCPTCKTSRYLASYDRTHGGKP